MPPRRSQIAACPLGIITLRRPAFHRLDTVTKKVLSVIRALCPASPKFVVLVTDSVICLPLCGCPPLRKHWRNGWS